MATIFLSYRRTDSPQACRVYDWLVQRFGSDAVFMDVAAIPFAVSFPAFIREAIADSRILITLIGAHWQLRIQEADDPVRMEIETAIANRIPVLPVLIGNTVMPKAGELPASIAAIATQNAVTVGVSHDFDTHMRQLLPKIESILGALALGSVVTSDPEVIVRACTVLREVLLQYFNDNELRTVCFDLGVEYDDLGGEGRSGKARELIAYLERRSRLGELAQMINRERPEANLDQRLA